MKTQFLDWISIVLVALVLIGACTPNLFWRAALMALALLISLLIVLATVAKMSEPHKGAQSSRSRRHG